MYSDGELPAMNAKMELRAYAARHRSELVDRGRPLAADLVSVNYRSARLRLPAREQAPAWGEGHRLVLNLRIARSQGLTENVPCQVRWVQGDDLGVEFTLPLQASVLELQGWLEN